MCDLCVLEPVGLLALSYAIDKAYAYDERWLALRVSYGFNGVVIREPELPSLVRHLAAHPSRRPPDHLLFEWCVVVVAAVVLVLVLVDVDVVVVAAVVIVVVVVVIVAVAAVVGVVV